MAALVGQPTLGSFKSGAVPSSAAATWGGGSGYGGTAHGGGGPLVPLPGAFARLPLINTLPGEHAAV